MSQPETSLLPAPALQPVRNKGGRPPGASNKATAEWRAFAQHLFREAFSNVEARQHLIGLIRRWELDPAVLRILLAYAYGAPQQQIDLNHSGTVTLAQLVSGSVLQAAAEEDEDPSYHPAPFGHPASKPGGPVGPTP